MRALVNMLRNALRPTEMPPGPEGGEGTVGEAFTLPDYRALEKRSVSGVGQWRRIGPTLQVNTSDSTPAGKRKTVVVLGGYRGGTSMVAGLLRLMGVFMGFQIDRGNNEDLDFQGAPPERVIELVEERNSMFDLWGWKYPGSIYTIDKFRDHLRNPHFIVIFRDLMASAQSEMAKGIYGFEEGVWRAADQQMRLADFVLTSSHPTLTVSYERAVRDDALFVRSLAEFVGLEFPEEDLEKLTLFLQDRWPSRVSIFRRRIGLEHYAALEHRHEVRDDWKKNADSRLRTDFGKGTG